MTVRALDHLTLLDRAPDELVRDAAHAGFTHVGLRVRPLDAGERRWDLRPGTMLRSRTLDALAETGIGVSQVEVVFLDHRTDVGRIAEDLEVGVALGARYLYVVGMDDDLVRFTETFAALERLCRAHGIRPLLEPMAYRPVRDVACALTVVEATATGGVLVDALHVSRAGTDLDVLRAADPFRLPLVQLCDARQHPSDTPRDLVAVGGQDTAVGDLQWEARVGRLLPGSGTLDLVRLLSALPVGVERALEVPDARLIAEIGREAFLARGRRALEVAA